MFLNIRHQLLAPELLHNSTILAPKNNTVNALNGLLLASMPRHQITSASINYYKDETGASSYPIKFLHTINLTALPPHQLHLKVGYPVILLYNINPSNGLCNRTRLIVLFITPRLLKCSILRL
jgi:ATP-dependent DNA helicase PIF1